jgi:hypothetical protein
MPMQSLYPIIDITAFADQLAGRLPSWKRDF